MLDLKILRKRNISFANCPNCGVQFTLDRVKPETFIQKYSKLIGFKEYHCRKCKWTGYLFIYKITEDLKKVFLNYIIVIIIFVLLVIILRAILKSMVK
ncbi:MAG: hypothetical protein N2490_05425 [Ignavibacteria bacterium]|nr:hypothetical protein [Ignavibacteria bacterium]